MLAAGCDDFLGKPFHETDIFDMIQRHLGVRYIYEKSEQEPNVAGLQGQAPEDVLMMKVPATSLPPELLDNLEQVTIRLNAEMINKAIEAIRPHNAALANRLARSAESFKYDHILALIQEIREERDNE